jgi:osmotically inducible protein OsmC
MTKFHGGKRLRKLTGPIKPMKRGFGYEGSSVPGNSSCLKSIACYREGIGRRAARGVLLRWQFDFDYMNRNASAVWRGNLREGEGTLSTESGILAQTQYSYGTSFLEGIGTNPEELIAASLSGCFTMALSSELGLCGFQPERIETTATATLEDLAAGWTLTHIQLDVHASVPNISRVRFIDAALAAKTNCPIARVLKTNISMTASLDL